MKFWDLAAVTMTLAIIAAAPDSAYSQECEYSAGGKARNVTLTPPPDAPDPGLGGVYGPAGGQVTIYPAGCIKGAFATFFPDNMVYRVHNLACRTGWYTRDHTLDEAANEFYAIYLIIGDGQRMKVQTFNTVCAEGGGAGWAVGGGSFTNFAYLGGFLAEAPLEGLFTEDVTIEIYVEHDDGWNAPTPHDLKVLSGTDPGPSGEDG